MIVLGNRKKQETKNTEMATTTATTMPQKFLIIRFRQLGDTVCTTPIMETLKRNFSGCQVDIVLNERLVALLDNHPYVDNVIPFSDRECHNIALFILKVWRIMHQTRYDMIIDMRSTPNILLFSLLSGGVKIRSGVGKSYAKYILTDSRRYSNQNEYMVDFNLSLLSPLERFKHLFYVRRTSLVVLKEEHRAFVEYMKQCGIDFKRPIMLAGVTAKLSDKAWKREYMTQVLRRITTMYPQVQIVLNYAPGHEEAEARAIASDINSENIFLNVNADNIRKLMAMVSCCSFYFGNEGGTRHIVEALGKPTFCICSPSVNPKTWISNQNGMHQTISSREFATQEQLAQLSYTERYELIRPSVVSQRLAQFISACLQKDSF